jgi:Fe-S-cluster containining protein
MTEYIRVFGVDRDRMGDIAARYTALVGNQLFMRMGEGRCAALQIDPVRRRFSCGIYEVRPDTCRSLVAGTGACLAEIHAKSDRALQALQAVAPEPCGKRP